MFVDVEFEAREHSGLTIPAEAVLDSGLRKIVYVETADGVFEPRAVELAGHFGDRVLVVNGVSEGDKIVVSGNFLLDSESRMRSEDQTGSGSPPDTNLAGRNTNQAAHTHD
jgi:Cu(I)/Ag(I) efflux system membrane fusion protein